MVLHVVKYRETRGAEIVYHERWHLLGRNQLMYNQFCHSKRRVPEEGPVKRNAGTGNTESKK